MGGKRGWHAVAARATTDTTKRSTLGRRLRRWVGVDYEEDGVFRPVRLSLAVDLGISVGIVVLVLASFGGFIAWLAATQ
jgi:hypothetical protein